MAEATADWAPVGDLLATQISAESECTSATALPTSIGAWLTKANEKVASSFWVGGSAGVIGGIAAVSRDSMSSSETPSTEPDPQVTWTFDPAFKAWSNVFALTATPLGSSVTATTPGMLRAADASYAWTLPLSVGGLITTVGRAPSTSTSSAYFAAPVTMLRASIRVVDVPMRRYCDAGFGSVDTAGSSSWAAASVSDPYVAERPSGAQTAVSRVVKESAGKSHRSAAAVTRRARACAAIERTGSHSERTEDDPPVDCAVPRSWRASSSGASTSTRRASISSATMIASAVVTPCPTSARGTRKTIRFSGVTSRTN